MSSSSYTSCFLRLSCLAMLQGRAKQISVVLRVTETFSNSFWVLFIYFYAGFHQFTLQEGSFTWSIPTVSRGCKGMPLLQSWNHLCDPATLRIFQVNLFDNLMLHCSNFARRKLQTSWYGSCTQKKKHESQFGLIRWGRQGHLFTVVLLVLS